jgi:hypothetical protein
MKSTDDRERRNADEEHGPQDLVALGAASPGGYDADDHGLARLRRRAHPLLVRDQQVVDEHHHVFGR